MIRVIERFALLSMTLLMLVVIPVWARGRSWVPNVVSMLEDAAATIDRIGEAGDAGFRAGGVEGRRRAVSLSGSGWPRQSISPLASSNVDPASRILNPDLCSHVTDKIAAVVAPYFDWPVSRSIRWHFNEQSPLYERNTIRDE